MLSSVLRSKVAIQINIAIMRAFVRLRELKASYKTIAQRLDTIEEKINTHDNHIKTIFQLNHYIVKNLPKDKKVKNELEK